MDRKALFDAVEAAATDVDAKKAALEQTRVDQAKVVAAANAKVASAQRAYDDALDAGQTARRNLEASLDEVVPTGGGRVRVAG
jgi:hypothetical protein